MSLRSGLAAIAVLAAVPAVAADPTYFRGSMVQGDVDLFAGFTRLNGSGSIFETSTLVGGAARGNVPLGNGLNIQADLQFLTRTDQDYSRTDAGHYLHLYKRDQNSAYGLFGGFATVDESQYHVIGLEIQRYYGDWFFYAQAAAQMLRNGSDSASGGMFRAQATFFANPNLSISGDAMYSHLSSTWMNDTFTFALTGNYRLPNSPFALFAQARWDNFPDNGSYVGTSFSGIGGFRVNIDPTGSTIRSHWLNGPAMNVLTPNFYSYVK